MKEDEKQEKIKELQEQIREIRAKGSFMESYYKIRKGSVQIYKHEKLTEKQKKEALKKLCIDTVALIDESL